MKYTVDNLIERITLEEESLSSATAGEKEIILNRIDQMISDLCQLLFYELGKTQKEIEEKTKELKRIYRKNVQDDMTSKRQLIFDAISAAAQIGGGIAVGWGGLGKGLGSLSGGTVKMLTSVGGAAQGVGQGVGQAGNISRGFKDAEQFKDQGLYEDSQRSISESHDAFREQLEQRKRQAQNARDEESKKFSLKRELTSGR